MTYQHDAADEGFNDAVGRVEDYALGHDQGRRDFETLGITGRIFDDHDRRCTGEDSARVGNHCVRQDETGKTGATAMRETRKRTLQPEEELVSGLHLAAAPSATKVSTDSIEARSGISCSSLASGDPLDAAPTGTWRRYARAPWQALEQNTVCLRGMRFGAARHPHHRGECAVAKISGRHSRATASPCRERRCRVRRAEGSGHERPRPLRRDAAQARGSSRQRRSRCAGMTAELVFAALRVERMW